MRPGRRRTEEARSGTAATELAIALPFVAFVFVAALDFGRVYFATQTLENCAYVGALYASGAAKIAPSSQNSAVSEQDRINAAKTAAVAESVSLDPPVDPARVQVTVSGGSATVTISYDFATLTPVLNSSRVVNLTRAVKMRQLN